MTQLPTTVDGLLNRRVQIEQPSSGYRIAVDTVLLASACPAVSGDGILDLGCGVGGAMLSLACRVKGISGIGVDIQQDLIEICLRNITRNPTFAKNLEAEIADARDLPPQWNNVFDQVVMNPPFHEETRHDPSPNKIKSTANTEKDGDLRLWIESAAQALKPSGSLTLIHRADRQEEILSCLQESFGEVFIVPLTAKKFDPPRRIILRARKDALFTATTCKPFALHKPQGGYTDGAEEILRNCQPLFFRT